MIGIETGADLMRLDLGPELSVVALARSCLTYSNATPVQLELGDTMGNLPYLEDGQCCLVAVT